MTSRRRGAGSTVTPVLREVIATRYVTPLREGGSLPGLMEADDLGTYVVKFVGAGQGRKTLVAEVVCAHLARGLALAVPAPVRPRGSPARRCKTCCGPARVSTSASTFSPEHSTSTRPRSRSSRDWPVG